MDRLFIENQYTANQREPHQTMLAVPGDKLRSSRFQQFTTRMGIGLAKFLIAYGTKLQDHYRQQMPVSVQRTNS
jgi:hypothetical protein